MRLGTKSPTPVGEDTPRGRRSPSGCRRYLSPYFFHEFARTKSLCTKPVCIKCEVMRVAEKPSARTSRRAAPAAGGTRRISRGPRAEGPDAAKPPLRIVIDAGQIDDVLEHLPADEEQAPPPERPMSVAQAAKTGTTRELLVAMRDQIAKKVDDENTPARDLAALTKRLMETVREIEAIDAREEEAGAGDFIGCLLF